MTATSAVRPKFQVTADLPTPAYVYDLDEVRRAHALLIKAVPQPSKIYYSVKANPHPEVVATLAALGCGAEVSSPGELAAALQAGVPGGALLYTGPGKRDEEVISAASMGVEWFSVDSPSQLAQVGRAAASTRTDPRCLLRVNGEEGVAGHGLAMTGGPSQFGADAQWIAAQPDRFRERVAGLHLYTGSNLADEGALADQFARSIVTAHHVAAALQLELEVLDLGGGFGAPFAREGDIAPFPGLGGAVAATLDAWFPSWRSGFPKILFESGRYLTATSGALLVRVVDVKRSQGRRVVVLESGINHLGGMSGLRRLPPLLPDVEAAGEPADGDSAMLVGPLCTPLDTWARSAELPVVRPGDVLRVPNVGAYGLTASLIGFLGHPTPLEVVVDRGELGSMSRLQLVRSREDPGRARLAVHGSTSAEPTARETGSDLRMDPSFIALLRPFLRYGEGATLHADERLRDLGLDSMHAVELLFAVEDEYDVVIADEDLTDETFATPHSLWAVIERARAAGIAPV